MRSPDGSADHLEQAMVNKHQIVGLDWVSNDGSETLTITGKSEARGWFTWTIGNRHGMIRKDGLLAHYRRQEH